MKRMALVAMLVAGCFNAASAAMLLVNGSEVDVPVCGGIAGIQCGAAEWCDFPDSNACGAGDYFGTCRPRPQACTRIYQPVCGCDGKTYGNRCDAEANGVDVMQDGEC